MIKNIIKKIIAIPISVCIVVLMTSSCQQSTSNDTPEEVHAENRYDDIVEIKSKYDAYTEDGATAGAVYMFEDPDTGVWYIEYSHGICPRYNADGTLFTSEDLR